MPESPEPWEWGDVSLEIVREVVRQSELHMHDLLAAALAADQRATNQAGILGGFGVGLLGAAATLMSSNLAHDAALAMVVAGGGLILGAFLSGYAAKPSDYFAIGFEPYRLLPAAKDEKRMLQRIAESVQQRIVSNERVLTKTAKFTQYGYTMAAASIGLAATVYLIIASF
jgi:hypothetical protein